MCTCASAPTCACAYALDYDSCANKVGKLGRSGSLLAVHVKVNCMKTSVTQRKKSGSLSRLAEQDLNVRKSNLAISSSRRTTEIGSSRPLLRLSECRGLKIGSDICTDSQVIADHFRDHFAKLAVSSPSLIPT